MPRRCDRDAIRNVKAIAVESALQHRLVMDDVIVKDATKKKRKSSYLEPCIKALKNVYTVFIDVSLHFHHYSNLLIPAVL